MHSCAFFCRPYIATVESANKTRKEKEEEDLAQAVRQADLKQLVARLENDLTALDGLSGGDVEAAKQTALDLKWIRERQMILIQYFM